MLRSISRGTQVQLLAERARALRALRPGRVSLRDRRREVILFIVVYDLVP
jgi:hypothetical protein